MIRNKKIGLPLATLWVAGTMMGSGVYLLPASLAALGSITTLAWIIALVAALLIAAVLGHLGRIAPKAGGLCGFPNDAFGHLAGFQSSVLYWFCAWIGNIAIALAAIGYLARLIPWLNDTAHLAIGVIALIWLVTFLNILGPRFACQVQSYMLVGLLPILLVAVGGWWVFDAETFRHSWNVSGQPLQKVIPDAVLLVFWAFTGLECASVGTAIVENPERNVPLATLGGVAIAGVVYIAASTVMLGMIPADRLAHSSAPFADAAQLILGTSAAAVVAALAFTKASGTLLSFVLVTAQVGRHAAERNFLPSVFARTDSQDIPVLNLVLLALIMSGVTLFTLSPTLNEQFSKLIEMSVLACLLAYIYACASIWKLPKLSGVRAQSGRYKWVSGLAIAICVWIIGMSNQTILALFGAAIVLVSAIYGLARTARLKRNGKAIDLR
jgi:arginine:agmatine antiporter